MTLDTVREIVVTIDPQREITVTPTSTGTVVMTTEDPQAMTIVEMSQHFLGELIDGLMTLRSEGGTR